MRKAVRLADATTRAALETLPEPIATIRNRAALGYVLEQVQWGQVLLDSTYMPRDPAGALKWFTMAADAGFGPAMNMCGRCSQFGWGCAQDLTNAASWYRKAMEHGDVWGCYNLGILAMRGLGVSTDLAQAVMLFRAGAEAGHAKSMNLLARFMEEGWETPLDPVGALAWYRRSAEEGDYRGQHNYATILAERGDLVTAMEWWRCAVVDATSDILLAMQTHLAALGQQGDPELLEQVRERLARLGTA